MIDFDQNKFFKLTPIPPNTVFDGFPKFLIEGESILSAFQASGDQLVFTNKRIISANKQGGMLSGKKIDYTSIPYSKIQAFSVETAGLFDRDCELEIYISSIGKLHFEIRGSFDLIAFNKVISTYVLG